MFMIMQASWNYVVGIVLFNGKVESGAHPTKNLKNLLEKLG